MPESSFPKHISETDPVYKKELERERGDADRSQPQVFGKLTVSINADRRRNNTRLENELREKGPNKLKESIIKEDREGIRKRLNEDARFLVNSFSDDSKIAGFYQFFQQMLLKEAPFREQVGVDPLFRHQPC